MRVSTQKKLALGLAVSTCLLSAHAGINSPEIVYGKDHRKDSYEVTNKLHKSLISSTAMQTGALRKNQDGTFSLPTASLKEEMNVCSKERFSAQPSPGRCSGFLVGENLLVTAGHCITSQSECSNYSWVFGFEMTDSATVNTSKIPASNVYSCKRIISQVLDETTENDYALVELDRKVEGRTPLKYRKSGQIKRGAKLVVIGHPSGLPVKVGDGAWVQRNKNPYFFSANLDTYGGNSGSAVFDAKTGLLEGILVRGGNDYVMNKQEGCMVSNRCTNSLWFERLISFAGRDCIGEDVTRITNIAQLNGTKSLYDVDFVEKTGPSIEMMLQEIEQMLNALPASEPDQSEE